MWPTWALMKPYNCYNCYNKAKLKCGQLEHWWSLTTVTIVTIKQFYKCGIFGSDEGLQLLTWCSTAATNFEYHYLASTLTLTMGDATWKVVPIKVSAPLTVTNRVRNDTKGSMSMYLLQKPFKTITYQECVSLTFESECPNGVDLPAILTMSMWLATACRQTG